MRFGLIASLFICAGLILLVALTGDGDAVDPWNVQDNIAVPAVEITGSDSVGQTFVSHYAYLHSIELRWIVSPDLQFAGDSRIFLHLRRAVDSAELAKASVALDDIRNNGFAKFSFSPIEDSQDRQFYFSLEASHAAITRGFVSVWASSDDDYPNGQMYVNGASTNHDLAFRAYYEAGFPILLRALQGAAERYRSTFLYALSLFAIPGLAFLLLFRKDDTFHPTEYIARAMGIGLAGLSFVSLFLFSFGAPVEWLEYCALGAVLVLLGGVWRASGRHVQVASARGKSACNYGPWLLTALALLSIAVGFLQIRDTVVPLWKDSPIHAETIAGILSQGHLPTNFFYHFGVQSIIALVVQLSGAAIPAAMLSIGPILITQIGLSVFLLSKRLTGSEIAGLVSAICVWFLSPTPAYFTTWGRYPLLLGAALLPLALLVGIEFVERPQFEVWTFILVLVTFWGLAFAHVRLAVFYLVFAVVYLAYLVWRARGARERRELTKRAGIALVGGLPFGVLWLAAINVNAPLERMLPQSVPDYALDLQTAIDISLTHHGPLLFALAAVAAVAAIFRRSRAALMTLAWFAALAGLAALPVVGEKYIPPAFVVLMAFIPVGILLGDLANWLYTRTAADSSRAAVVWIATCFVVSALGIRDIVSVVNPATILFADADQNAMAWIVQNTPGDSRFLINSEVWLDGSFSPSDGGWWISTLTGRSATFVDSPAITESADPETLARWIDANKVGFVYLGRRTGVLRGSDFDCQTERYTPVYRQDGITIFQVRPAVPTRLAPRAGCVGHLP